MPSDPRPADAAFKSWFNAARYRSLAAELAKLSPTFNRRRFLDLTLEGLERRELMDRVRQVAIAFEAAQPGTYREKVALLCKLAPRLEHGFVGVSLCDFVARYGLDDPDTSLDALRRLTRYGSAEFAVRPFLQRDLPGTLAVMQQWARDPDEHVRRLASEGSRPRLPWGVRLSALIADPRPTAPILEALKADPSLYVRKSVANHLNDLSKDHPQWVLDCVAGWDRSDARTAWIVARGLRTLVKQGDPRALTLQGVNVAAAPHLRVDAFAVRPSRLRLGQTLELQAVVGSDASSPERIVVDYVVHYPRASGATSRKVFKWTVLTLASGERATLTKRQVIRDFSIRRHHPGQHRVELQLNGQRLAESGFMLRR